MTEGPGRSGYGVFRIGDRLVAVPFDHLVEVCVVPDVSKLMVPDGAILGAFDLRGTLVPLVDLEALSGVPRRDRTVRRAAVLQHRDRITAIALDEIVTLTEAEPTETRHDDRATPPPERAGSGAPCGLFPGGFVLDGRIVSCLDTHALFARRDIPSIVNTRTAKRAAGLTHGRKSLIFNAGGAHFAIDAEHISATVPRKTVDTTEIGGDGGICMGFVEHYGWKVPVVHTNRVLGLGHAADIREAEIVVLRLPGERLLGLTVDVTERLAALAPGKTHESSAPVAAGGLLPRVFVTGDGTQIFMVDFAALIARPELASIAELSARKVRADAPPADAPAGTSPHGADGAIRESLRYLIFEAGCRMAVPAGQVARILHMPKTIVPPGPGPRSVRGYFAVGDRSVPLVSLSERAGEPADGGFVLLVAAGGRQVGFAARRICSMLTSEWRIPGGSSGPDGRDLVQLRDGGETRILPLADLARLAAAITGDGLPDHGATVREPA